MVPAAKWPSTTRRRPTGEPPWFVTDMLGKASASCVVTRLPSRAHTSGDTHMVSGSSAVSVPMAVADPVNTASVMSATVHVAIGTAVLVTLATNESLASLHVVRAYT